MSLVNNDPCLTLYAVYHVIFLSDFPHTIIPVNTTCMKWWQRLYSVIPRNVKKNDKPSPTYPAWQTNNLY